MERLTNKCEADAQREEYERRLANGYPRNIPEERFLRLAAYEDTGLEPEEITAMQHTLDEYHKVADPLLRAQADGRLVVLPFTSGRTLLSKDIDSPRLMKDVELAIRYCSSCGIVFYMGYNVFCDLVKHGRITAVSEETEKALGAMK